MLARTKGEIGVAHIAPAKAHTAAMGRRETKIYEDIINQGRTSFLSAPTVQGLLEGGVPVIKDGQCIGRAAGRIRHDDADGFAIGPGSVSGCCHRQGQGDGAQECVEVSAFHGCLPLSGLSCKV